MNEATPSMLFALLENCSSILQIVGSNVEVTSIVYDSRKVRQGSMYVARKGANTNGYHFIDSAIENGARAIVCEELPQIQHSSTAYVVVANSSIALAELSHALYNYPARSLDIIGITGTNGKTTCSFIIKQMLESIGKRVGLIGTTGNYIANEMLPATHTTPEAPELCALLATMKDRGVQTVVMEVSSHGLALHRVHGVSFNVAIFTNLTQDHLDFHGTMESYADAKKMLFDSLGTNAHAVVWNDSSYANHMYSSTAAHIHTVGRESNAEYTIAEESLQPHSTTFTLRHADIHTTYTTPLIGSFNVENASLCVVALQSLYPQHAESISTALANAEGAPGRMWRTVLPNNAVAIVDYAHTPDALHKALTTARELCTNGKLHCVFGCGGDRDTSKRPHMGAIAAQLADVVYITTDNPRTENPHKIIQDIQAGIPQHTAHAIHTILSRKDAIYTACLHSNPGDVVLIAGKGHEDYQIIGTEKLHFSDTEEVLHFAKSNK